MNPASPHPAPGGLKLFWARVTDGVALNDLWGQFRAEARSSYELYSNEVDWTRQTGESRGRRFLRVASSLFWAMLMKRSPGRRLLFLLGMVLLAAPGFRIQSANWVFETPNLSILGGAALVALLALELADRVVMKRDLEIAREIQSWLMPSAPPSLPGAEIAFATRPANTVAGDYYDAFFRNTEDGQRLLLVVADVAGKSIPAAMLMATMQASLRTLAAMPGPLLEVAERLNRYACAQNPSGRRFTTAFLAEYEPALGRITYVNAGHNFPVLRRASGAVERLEVGGIPLGILQQTSYEIGEATLGAGDLLIVFTDGLVEAENERKDEYGEPRMLSLIAGMGGASAAEALRRMLLSVEAFAGHTRQHDDITFLLLRKTSA